MHAVEASQQGLGVPLHVPCILRQHAAGWHGGRGVGWAGVGGHVVTPWHAQDNQAGGYRTSCAAVFHLRPAADVLCADNLACALAFPVSPQQQLDLLLVHGLDHELIVMGDEEYAAAKGAPAEGASHRHAAMLGWRL